VRHRSFKYFPARIKQDSRLIFLLLFTLGIMMVTGCISSTTASSPALGPTRLITATPIIPTITPTPNNSYDFTELIRTLEDTMPGPFSAGFIVPQESDRSAFHIITLSMIDDKSEIASKLASKYDYKISSLFDQGDSLAESYVLMEQSPIKRGWGLYIFRKSAKRDIVIEAPHPVADAYTPTVGLDLYRALDAKALLVAGAHRDANADGSADPTHTVNTIFQTIHTSLFKSTGQPDVKTVFIQIHGYSTEGHENYPQVVIGYNWKNDPKKDLLLGKIVNALQQAGLSAGVCEGNKFQGLCGTLNVQRQEMDGGIFIHLEISKAIREVDRELVTALQQALNP